MRIAPFLLSVLLCGTAVAAPVPSIQDANQQFRQGQHQSALEKVNGFLAANPKDAQGRFLKGLILTELNRQQEAIKVFTELAEDHPDLPEPHNNLAVLYASQGQYDRAKQSLEMAIRTHPSYATAHENLGDIYAKMASQAYDKALQLDRGNLSAQTKLSMIKDLLGPARTDTGKGKTQVAKLAKPKTAALAAEPAAAVSEPTPSATAAQPAKGKPSTAEAAKDKPAGAAKDIEKTIGAWAEAWSQRNVDAYLAFYAEGFKPAGDKPRAQWAEDRRVRITRPQYIKVEVSDMEIAVQGSQAEAKFKQRYESNTYREAGAKTLVLEKQADRWLIVEER